VPSLLSVFDDGYPSHRADFSLDLHSAMRENSGIVKEQKASYERKGLFRGSSRDYRGKEDEGNTRWQTRMSHLPRKDIIDGRFQRNEVRFIR